MMVQCIIFVREKQMKVEVNITIGCIHFLMGCLGTFFFYRAKSRDISTLMFFHVLSYIVSIALLVIISPLYIKNFQSGQNENDALMKSQQFSLTLYVMTIFVSKGVSFRIFCIMMLIITG